MQKTAATTGTTGTLPAQAAPTNGDSTFAGVAPLFTPEQLQELVAALSDPFDPQEIKWRVTNTSQVGSRNGPRLRGQMLAYADPRAYTDRLNDLFTPSGWTRDYVVQMVQNFERKERGATERSITAKIVVTCKVTILGFGAHMGLGEEWADNDNAGTAAEAQAFKRACSCFGLGRYLYDLEGQWVDLDDRKRPLQTPNLPEWVRPRRQLRSVQNGRRLGNRQSRAGSKGTAGNGRGGLSVLRAVANREEVHDSWHKECSLRGALLSHPRFLRCPRMVRALGLSVGSPSMGGLLSSRFGLPWVHDHGGTPGRRTRTPGGENHGPVFRGPMG